MRSRHLQVAALALCLTNAPLAAQAPVRRGETVRLRLSADAVAERRWRRDADRWGGTVRDAGPDSLMLALRDGRRYTFAWRELDALERRSGHESRALSAQRGALVGAGVGAGFLVGWVLLLHANGTGCEVECLSFEDEVTLAAVVGGAGGSAIGLLLGAASPRARWEPVGVRASVGLHRVPRGIGLRVSLAR